MLCCRSQTPVTMLARSKSGSTSRIAFSSAAVIFAGGSPTALRATSISVAAPLRSSLTGTESRRTSGCCASGNSSCSRSVLICDVGKSAVTPTMVSVLRRPVLVTGSPEREPLADGLGIRKEFVGERFRDDGHHRGAGAVVDREAAPAQERDAHRVQVAVADACHVGGGDLRAPRSRPSASRLSRCDIGNPAGGHQRP